MRLRITIQLKGTLKVALLLTAMKTMCLAFQCGNRCAFSQKKTKLLILTDAEDCLLQCF